jgi:hypothetical protein
MSVRYCRLKWAATLQFGPSTPKERMGLVTVGGGKGLVGGAMEILGGEGGGPSMRGWLGWGIRKGSARGAEGMATRGKPPPAHDK